MISILIRMFLLINYQNTLLVVYPACSVSLHLMSYLQVLLQSLVQGRLLEASFNWIYSYFLTHLASYSNVFNKKLKHKISYWVHACYAPIKLVSYSVSKQSLGYRPGCPRSVLCKLSLRRCTKELSFPLTVFSVNVTKSAVSCGLGHIYWRNS